MSKEKIVENAETLLEQFIIGKQKAYVEPQRKGTPKGDPIGFTKKKYGISLLMLIKGIQKRIAKRGSVSHNLLRKWNTESAFKEAITTHATEFVNILFEMLSEAYAKAYKNKEGPPGWKRADINYDLISDRKQYGDSIISIIKDKTFSILSDPESDSLNILTAVFIYKLIIGKSMLSEKVEREITAACFKTLTDIANNILDKKTISEDDREFLKGLLEAYYEEISSDDE